MNMKKRIFFWRKWPIWILIGLFSILFASQVLAEETILDFHNLKVDQGLTTTSSITNLEDKDILIKVLFFDENGDFSKPSNIESLKVRENKEISSGSIPPKTKSLKVESDGNIQGICLLETEHGRKSEAIPLIYKDYCEEYSTFFEEASNKYGIPSNLLCAIARAESTNCDQGALNPNDSGCGVMQITGDTIKDAAKLLNVTEDELCANTLDGARLNIF
jgi:hypothetical protein